MAARLFLLLLLISGVACASSDQAISIPSPEVVSSISIIQKDDGQSSKVIADRGSIEKVLKLVAENNSGWSKPWDTFPSPTASAIFKSQNSTDVFVFWFGSNWLGARSEKEGKTTNVLWHVRPEVALELRRTLGIKP